MLQYAEAIQQGHVEVQQDDHREVRGDVRFLTAVHPSKRLLPVARLDRAEPMIFEDFAQREAHRTVVVGYQYKRSFELHACCQSTNDANYAATPSTGSSSRAWQPPSGRLSRVSWPPCC